MSSKDRYFYSYIGYICEVLDNSRIEYHHCNTWFKLFLEDGVYSITSIKNNNKNEVIMYKGDNISRCKNTNEPIVFQGTLQNFEMMLCEKMWEEFEDVLFIEDEESDDSCNLVLASDWHYFSAGTTRDEIWRWFDQKHSKGLHWLMYGDTTKNEGSL